MLKIIKTKKYWDGCVCKHCQDGFKKREEIYRIISKGRNELASEHKIASLHKRCLLEVIKEIK